MKTFKESYTYKGWFIGDFDPSIFKTNNCEVAVKRYNKGDREDFHHHKISTEITMIVEGKVKMNGIEYIKGDIILIEPKEGTDFEALEDSISVVVKIPCSKNDKYIGEYKDDTNIT